MKIDMPDLAGLEKAMKEFPAVVGAKAMRTATVGSLNVLRKSIQEKVPERAGHLRRSMVTSVAIQPRDQNGEIVTGGIRFRRKGFVWHFLEFGTASRQLSSEKKNAARGKVTADPFIRPAVDQKRDEVIEGFAKRFQRALKRWGKKHGAR